MAGTSRLQIKLEKWKIREIKVQSLQLGHDNMGEYVWSLVKRDVPLDVQAKIRLREKVE